ncbi:MAG TPA: DUF1569 domain-containing protein [Acidobacteriaceae bacterium]|nr:DUF1569 domain-containing protein [Acidobacteriaceae bacterium]
MKTLSSAHDLAEIRTRLDQVTALDARLWGSMTSAQMLCHLRDGFAYPLGERDVAPVKRTPLPRPLFRWLALRAPMKWPHGVPAPPEIDQHIGGTQPVDFECDRAALLEKIDRFAHAAGPFGPHPLFGAITLADWMRWGYLHCDHHLRQFGR